MNLLPQQSDAKKHLADWKIGALFMEAGTGKTRVACELVNSVPNIDHVFWFGPLATLGDSDQSSVCREIQKWGGFNAPATFCGVESIGCSDRIYLNIREQILSCSNPFVVVDESLKIKNFTAKRTKRLLEISTLVEYKLILNGTPLSKNLIDLWSQMEFLSPKILNMPLDKFKNVFCEYTTVTKRFSGYKQYTKEFITGYTNIDYLYSLIRHYVYECDLSLAIKQNYQDIRYHLSDECKEDYEYLKKTYLDDEMLEWKNNNIFMEMTQHMQHSYCCTPNKFEVLDELFQSIPQKKTIIFCKYVTSREQCAKRYPDAMVLSYQKNSLGLNLQDYNHTVYFDKIWDYALRTQSSRRTFRTGQEHNCYYYDLTGNVGLESLIDKNIEKKITITEYFKKATKEQLTEEL